MEKIGLKKSDESKDILDLTFQDLSEGSPVDLEILRVRLEIEQIKQQTRIAKALERIETIIDRIWSKR